MNPTTRIRPARPVIAPMRMASLPRSGPTVRSSITLSGTGSAPARSSAASEAASATVKLPLICPVPPVIGSWMTGALSTLRSSTMANGSPTCARVSSAKRLAPTLSKRNVTIGWPVCWSKPAVASARRSPCSTGCRSTG